MRGKANDNIQSIVNRYNSTGLSTPGQREGPRRIVWTKEIRTQLHSLIEDNQTTTVEEIQKGSWELTYANTTVWRWIEQELFTYKLTRPIYQPVNEYIRWYTSTYPIFRYRNILFIDESPFDLHMFRSNSRARRGSSNIESDGQTSGKKRIDDIGYKFREYNSL
ncbi:hypothetical protein RF11_12165 [Thelohanellus kitauei]|uniref:Uncharacterized protein n=1 Tax=Thelohanellus kitauei TaxID=669202 RepID=A0A0C2M7I4_THEKT|nr:hypothetical protein RF11_12165 [Thelohanellus kitauei]